MIRKPTALLTGLIAPLCVVVFSTCSFLTPVDFARQSVGSGTIFGDIFAPVSGNGNSVRVFLDGPVYRSTQTSATGIRFSFSQLPDGEYSLKAQRDGYVSYALGTAWVSGASTVRRDIQLYPVPTLPEGESWMKVSEIQGRGHKSPYENRIVKNVLGIITNSLVVDYAENDFPFYSVYIRDIETDADLGTSDALQVYIPNPPASLNLASGTLVWIKSALVREDDTNFPFQDFSYEGNLTRTQLRLSYQGTDGQESLSILATGVAVPQPILIGSSGRSGKRAIPIIASKNAPNGTIYDPAYVPEHALYAIDFFESLEAMKVRLENGVIIEASNDYGDCFVTSDNGIGLRTRSLNGGALLESYDGFVSDNLMLIDVDSPYEKSQSGFTRTSLGVFTTGTTLTSVEGLIDFSRNHYAVRISDYTGAAIQTRAKETNSYIKDASHLVIASMNVENLSPWNFGLVHNGGDTRTPTHIQGIATTIATNLNYPDIIGMLEIQDASGETNDGTTNSTNTLQTLSNLVGVIPGYGVQYAWADVAPIDNENGGAPGGNIRTAFFYNPSRVGFAIKNPPAGVQVREENVRAILSGATASLSWNPGSIGAQDELFEFTRKPLIGEFTFNGRKVFVIVNHWNSKIGDSPIFGPFQPPLRGSESKRAEISQYISGFLQDVFALEPHAKVVLTGDFNDYHFAPTLKPLENVGMYNLHFNNSAPERYSYMHNGQAQTLDHIFVSPALKENSLLDVVRVFRDTPFSTAQIFSDHEPLVARVLIE